MYLESTRHQIGLSALSIFIQSDESEIDVHTPGKENHVRKIRTNRQATGLNVPWS